jgi:hypothetical protein
MNPENLPYYSNGVMTLGEALYEFFMEKYVTSMASLVHPEDHFETVEHYAVLHVPAFHYYGWDHWTMQRLDLTESPYPRTDLGLLIRQAVLRSSTIEEGYLAEGATAQYLDRVLTGFNLTGLSFWYAFAYMWTPEYAEVEPNEFIFSDYQTAANGALIDFSGIHRLYEWHQNSNYSSKLVLPLKDWFATCSSFPASQLILPLHECRKKLQQVKNVLFRRPARDCHFPAEYDCLVIMREHPWSGNYTGLCRNFPSAQQRLLAREGYSILDALQADPHYFRVAFACLQDHYQQLPPLERPLSSFCEAASPSHLTAPDPDPESLPGDGQHQQVMSPEPGNAAELLIS